MVKEAKLFFLTLFIGVGAILIIYLTSFFYASDINHILNEAHRLSFLTLDDFHPEPLEKLQSILFFISLPLFSILYFKFLSRKLNFFFQKHKLTSGAVSTIVGIILILTIFFTFIHYYDDDKVVSYLHLYFLYNLDYTYNFIFYIVFFLVLASFFLPSIRATIVYFSDYIFILFSIFIFFFLYSENYPYQNSYHFDALFFSQYQVSIHQLILCTHGFKNTYGLYPHFLNWIFDFIPLSINHFKIVFILLLNLSFLFLYLFLKKVLDNKFLVIVTIISYMYYVGIYRIVVGHDLYFQYFPLRILFPFLSLYLISIYEEEKTFWKFILISIIAAFAILWNPDSGIMTLLMWLGYLSYSNLYTRQVTQSIKKIFLSISSSILIVSSILGLYSLLIILKYDTPFIWKDFFLVMQVFSSLGYYMIPLPQGHPYIVYIAFIVISISFIFFFINRKKHTGLLLWSLWMIASFMYFQGRSHPYSFFAIIANILIILPLLLQSFEQEHMAKNMVIFETKFILILLTSFFISNAILFTYNYLTHSYYKIILLPPAPSPTKLNFIKKYVSEQEQILILDPESEAVLYATTKTIPAYDNGLIDMFLRSDYDDLTTIIKKGQIKKIFISKKQLHWYQKSLKIKYTMVQDKNLYLLYYKLKGSE